MKEILGKSTIFALISILAMYFFRVVFKTDAYLSDIGGIQSFLGVFGTLFGIMAAFVVVEVWGEFNTTVSLIEREALGLEKLYDLALYFRDRKLSEQIKKTIKKYIELVVKNFRDLGEGKRNTQNSQAFRAIANVLREIRFDDDHDQAVFALIISHYKELAQIRVDRINQCLVRLPVLLKAFLYITSFVGLLTFVIMPFANMYYGFIATGFLSFILAMVFQLVEDLDNPFVGYWNISPEPFERALKHIEEDY